MTTSDKNTKVIRAVAAKLHEGWRADFQAKNPGQTRIKKNSDGTSGDINQPFETIHPDWQKENIDAAVSALKAIDLYPNDRRKAADVIHEDWMVRNPKADWNSHLHVPFEDLPENEQAKDLIIVDIAIAEKAHLVKHGCTIV